MRDVEVGGGDVAWVRADLATVAVGWVGWGHDEVKVVVMGAREGARTVVVGAILR